MLEISELLTLGLVLLLTFWIYRATGKPKRYPPGPCGIPVFGYIPFFDFISPHKSLRKLSRLHGDVFSISLGNRDIVYLSSYGAAKEAVGNPHIQGPLDIATYKIIGPSILTKPGSFSEFQRQFTLSYLTSNGSERTNLETLVSEEAETLIQKFNQKLGKSFLVSNDFNIATMNILWKLIASLQLNEGNRDYQMLIHTANKAKEAFGSRSLADFLTCGASGISKLDSLCSNMNSFIQKLIDVHEETLDSQNPRDYIDAFLIKRKEEGASSVSNSWFTYDVLKANILDLFLSGFEPASTGLEGAVLRLAQHPDVQEKIKKQIRNVTGGERRVCLGDRNKLPLLEAFIMEAQRHSCVYEVSHYTTENTTLGDFEIPKSTIVLADMWSIHKEEKHWSEPFKFQPNRFLNKDGSVNYKKDGFMPFSIAKRSELGQHITKTQLFLFLGHLLQDFAFPAATDKFPFCQFDVTGNDVLHSSPYDVLAIQTQTYNV